MNSPAEHSHKHSANNLTTNEMGLTSAEFEKSGLYLVFPDGRRIDLTREKIEAFAHSFESNLDQLPDRIKSAAAFKACPVCPEKDRAAFCHALPATLAFMEELEGLKSYDKVDAVYRGSGPGLVWVPGISMQEALQFVAILSLMFYCEVGRKYWKFFLGVHPLLSPHEMTAKIYLNMFWDCKGDRKKTEQILGKFAEEINCTCRCQVQRLRLICRSDVLMAAFVNTQNQIEYLALCKDALLEQSFEDFLKNS
jgi:hypothetical protein